ncbi:MAG: YceI family protein [Prolixibacteraceae bacterium]
MKEGLAIIIFVVISWAGQAQLPSREVVISFFSEAPLEDIKSESTKGVSAIDTVSDRIYFKVPVRSFEFEKSLMQEHFNENYLESSKYPNAEFSGTIKGPVNFSRDGNYPVTVQGDLTIHNVPKNYTVKGVMKVKGGEITAHAVFPVHIADHRIKIPRLVIKNIAEVVEVTINAIYEPETK